MTGLPPLPPTFGPPPVRVPHRRPGVGEKLVRDGIPAIAEANDGVPYPHRVAAPEEMPGLLRAKLREEVDEYLASGDPGELADVLEVLLELAATHGVTRAKLEFLRLTKVERRGGFSRRLVWTPQAVTR